MTPVTLLPQHDVSNPRKAWAEQHRVTRVLDGLRVPAEKPGVFASYRQIACVFGVAAVCVLAAMQALEILRFTARMVGVH